MSDAFRETSASKEVVEAVRTIMRAFADAQGETVTQTFGRGGRIVQKVDGGQYHYAIVVPTERLDDFANDADDGQQL